jgi:hypothetical protein
VIGKIKFVKEGKGYAFVTPCAHFFDFRANYHLFLLEIESRLQIQRISTPIRVPRLPSTQSATKALTCTGRSSQRVAR